MKKFLCALFGHRKNGSKRFIYNGEGVKTWVTTCKRCERELFHAKGMIPTEPEYVTTIVI